MPAATTAVSARSPDPNQSSVGAYHTRSNGPSAPRIQGLAVGLAVGGKEVQGVVVAPAYFHLAAGGRLEGVSVSAFNRVLGEQRGVAIGLLNYASRLHGVQIGLVNWADNNPAGLKVLPVANAHFE